MNLTYDKIKALGPCYDPVKFIPVNWEGSIINILEMEAVPAKDRLWVALNGDFMGDRVLRLFACACATQALKLQPNPDPRSLKAIEVAEAYANGKATKDELASASASASAASAESAAWSAYWAAEAARSAAEARSAARSAAWSAYSAARSAARSAAAARSAEAQEEQVRMLIKIIKETQ